MNHATVDIALRNRERFHAPYIREQQELVAPSLSQEETTVSGIYHPPDVIYLLSIDVSTIEVSDGQETLTSGGRWTTDELSDIHRYVRADVLDEAAERIAQLEADLKDADEEACTLRNIICDEWRKHAEETEMLSTQDPDATYLPETLYIVEDLDGRRRIAYSDGPGYVRYSQLSQEKRDLLELASLLVAVHLAHGVAVDWKIYSDGSQNINIDGDVRDFSDYQQPIGWLRARLRPERPTAEEMVGVVGWAIEALAEGQAKEALDVLQEIYDRHEAADRYEDENKETPRSYAGETVRFR